MRTLRRKPFAGISKGSNVTSETTTLFMLSDGRRVVLNARWESLPKGAHLALDFACDSPIGPKTWAECLAHLSDWADTHTALYRADA